MFVRLCSIEFDYFRLLNCSITESSIAFDFGTDFRSLQLVFFFLFDKIEDQPGNYKTPPYYLRNPRASYCEVAIEVSGLY